MSDSRKYVQGTYHTYEVLCIYPLRISFRGPFGRSYIACYHSHAKHGESSLYIFLGFGLLPSREQFWQDRYVLPIELQQYVAGNTQRVAKLLAQQADFEVTFVRGYKQSEKMYR